ncbi:MAG: damage-inducible protein DinB [Acidobacteriota bacterium]|nr:damage-inducible protein DinB [Acidobacteriota bacterium]
MPSSPSSSTANPGTYGFLLDTYETEILKITGIWRAFPEDSLSFRPAPKSRTVLEQMEHQVQSEGRWMSTMLEIDTGDPNPAEKTARGYIEKYRGDAMRRLEILRSKSDGWWRGTAQFFDVPRSRAWIFLRRLNHSTHHRGQLIVYLRVLGARVPSVYGPTADTDERVIYEF